jgi:hypothetical protein
LNRAQKLAENLELGTIENSDAMSNDVNGLKSTEFERVTIQSCTSICMAKEHWVHVQNTIFVPI